MSDQRIRNIRKRRLNALLILRHRAVALRLRQTHIRFQTPRTENRLAYLRHEVPGAARPRERGRQLRALAAEQSTQTELREVSRFSDADVRVRKHQSPFRRPYRHGRLSSKVDGSPAGTCGGISC